MLKIQIRNLINKNNLIRINQKFFCHKNNGSKYNPETLDPTVSKLEKKFEILPEKIKNLLKLGRYDRIKPILLLYYPCTWGLALGSSSITLPLIGYLALIFSSSVTMRAAGCIINDLWDKDLDNKVERTKDRPITSGKIKPIEALLFLIPHLGYSLFVLLKLPMSSVILALSIMPVVIIYPFMKRVTNFPQFFLGLCFNSGVIICYPILSQGHCLDLALTGSFYVVGVLWTLIYDTVYAHMDKLDDKSVQIKSTAIHFGEKTKLYCYTFTFIIFLILLYKLNREESKNKFVLNSCILISVLSLVKNIKEVNLNEPSSCLKHFQKMRSFGLFIFFTCLAFNHSKINHNERPIYSNEAL